MSIEFNDTTKYKGLVQIYEKEIGANRTDVSGDPDRLLEFTADCNIAIDDFMTMAIQASGKWQFDDSGHSKYPIIKTNLVSGQRDYSFTVDEQSNLILDIYKVMILPSATETLYQSLDPIDELEEDNDILTERTSGGVPYGYGKLANGIFLEPMSNYNATNGLKVYINREGSYFTTGDTTKKPGVPGLFHEYFALVPALKYAGRHSLSNYKDLYLRVQKLETNIEEYFGQREKDVRHYLTNEPIIFM